MNTRPALTISRPESRAGVEKCLAGLGNTRQEQAVELLKQVTQACTENEWPLRAERFYRLTLGLVGRWSGTWAGSGSLCAEDNAPERQRRSRGISPAELRLRNPANALSDVARTLVLYALTQPEDVAIACMSADFDPRQQKFLTRLLWCSHATVSPSFTDLSEQISVLPLDVRLDRLVSVERETSMLQRIAAEYELEVPTGAGLEYFYEAVPGGRVASLSTLPIAQTDLCSIIDVLATDPKASVPRPTPEDLKVWAKGKHGALASDAAKRLRRHGVSRAG